MSANSNAGPSEIFPTVGSVEPQSVATATPVVSGWIQVGGSGVSAAIGRWLSLNLSVGHSATCTNVAVTAQQAKTSGGGSAKALTNPPTMSVTPSTSVEVSAQYDLALDQQMDLNNGFDYVQFTITTTGGATICSMDVVSGPASYES
jgi:hypothetical protein